MMLAESTMALIADRTEIPRRRVLLASRSARRRELLAREGIEHDAVEPEFDDSGLTPGRTTPEGWVMALAYLKAWAAARDAGDARIVVGADTMCLQDGRMMGTPSDAEEARAMLESFQGREHDVLTGVALIDTGTGRRRLFADRAKVRLGRLESRQIEEYLASGEWRGKAGGYNLTDRLEAGWPIEFEGDAGTIMGLPIGRLRKELAAFESTD
jgi:septum formation protein